MLRSILAAVFVLALCLALDNLGVPYPLRGRPEPTFIHLTEESMPTVTLTKTLENGTTVSETWTQNVGESDEDFAKRVRDGWKAICDALDG